MFPAACFASQTSHPINLGWGGGRGESVFGRGGSRANLTHVYNMDFKGAVGEGDTAGASNGKHTQPWGVCTA